MTLLSMLRCPYCRDDLQFEATDVPDEGRGKFGVLRCSCSVFPVVDGIPVIQRNSVSMLEHTSGREESAGIDIDGLVALLQSGQGLEALLRCLAYSRVPDRLRKAIGWRLSQTETVQRVGRTLGYRLFTRRVLAHRDKINACDVLSYYYFSDGPLNPQVGHYFIRKFSQPRHLAALSLAERVSGGNRPILDIACGIGHLEHYLTCREHRADAVGLDMNFYHLWIAQHWIAPGAMFVCGNAGDGLPFRDDSFSATFCVDAYHYIANSQTLLQEIERCAPGRRVIVSRVGNASVWPNEGIERSFDQYLQEFGGDVRVFHEGQLLDAYTMNESPLESGQASAATLRRAKWLSFAWGADDAGSEETQEQAVRPHAVGILGPNPIYARSRLANGDWRLNFEFPDKWYAYENHAMLSYHPRQALIPRDIDTASPQPCSRVRDLIDSYVLLGLPARFTDLVDQEASSRN